MTAWRRWSDDEERELLAISQATPAYSADRGDALRSFAQARGRSFLASRIRLTRVVRHPQGSREDFSVRGVMVDTAMSFAQRARQLLEVRHGR